MCILYIFILAVNLSSESVNLNLQGGKAKSTAGYKRNYIETEELKIPSLKVKKVADSEISYFFNKEQDYKPFESTNDIIENKIATSINQSSLNEINSIDSTSNFQSSNLDDVNQLIPDTKIQPRQLNNCIVSDGNILLTLDKIIQTEEIPIIFLIDLKQYLDFFELEYDIILKTIYDNLTKNTCLRYNPQLNLHPLLSQRSIKYNGIIAEVSIDEIKALISHLNAENVISIFFREIGFLIEKSEIFFSKISVITKTRIFLFFLMAVAIKKLQSKVINYPEMTNENLIKAESYEEDNNIIEIAIICYLIRFLFNILVFLHDRNSCLLCLTYKFIVENYKTFLCRIFSEKRNIYKIKNSRKIFEDLIHAIFDLCETREGFDIYNLKYTSLKKKEKYKSDLYDILNS